MSSKSRTSAVVNGFLLFALILGGIYAINRTVVSNQGGSPLDTIPEGLGQAPEVAEPESTDQKSTATPAVLVLTANGSARQLVRQGADEATLFTDSDEERKLTSVLGTDYRSRVFAWMTTGADAVSGVLAAIATDGTGKVTALADELSASSPPALAADGKTLAFVGFDNTEGNFGFTLYTQATEGGDAQAVSTSAGGIALPRWSTDGALAYVVGQATPDTGVKLTIRRSGKSTTVLTTEPKQTITDLTWLGTNSLAIVVEPLGNGTQNQASVMIVSAVDGKAQRSIDLGGKERSLRGTKDGEYLALITGTVEDAVAPGDGAVTLIHVSTGDQTTYGKGLAIAGFLQ